MSPDNTILLRASEATIGPAGQPPSQVEPSSDHSQGTSLREHIICTEQPVTITDSGLGTQAQAGRNSEASDDAASSELPEEIFSPIGHYDISSNMQSDEEFHQDLVNHQPVSEHDDGEPIAGVPITASRTKIRSIHLLNGACSASTSSSIIQILTIMTQGRSLSASHPAQ